MNMTRAAGMMSEVTWLAGDMAARDMGASVDSRGGEDDIPF
jgi:hypothetical protein